MQHIGNNIYLGWASLGDSREDVSDIQHALYIEVDTGIISQFKTNAWNTVTHSTKPDGLFASIVV